MNKFIDHTLLAADASEEEIIKLCREAEENKFMSVCIQPSYLDLAYKELKNTEVKLCTVIGFPLGANTSRSKVFETEDALSRNADEIDMVINVSQLKAGNDEYVYQEIRDVKDKVGEKILKVIIETALLTDEEIVKASQIAVRAGADFIKTSTGFSSSGAKVEDIQLIKSVVKDEAKIKASGGIRTRETMLAMIKAGASRIGASAGIELIKED